LLLETVAASLDPWRARMLLDSTHPGRVEVVEVFMARLSVGDVGRVLDRC